MNFLSIDVGTTCCKCQLFDESGAILEYISEEYALCRVGNEEYADLDAIRNAVFGLIRKAAEKHRVDSVCISCFGETFVALDKEGNVLFRPMLYTDKRGGEQAERIEKTIGADRIFSITGTVPHAMYSLYKLLWLKEREKEIFARIDKVLLIGDYLGYLLTGRRVIDYSLAARTGLFDISKLVFSEELCAETGIDPRWFSRPARAGTVVGEINEPSLGLGRCLLVLGAHDQVCTALGAGIVAPGRAVDGLGTVECINVVYEGVRNAPAFGRAGMCCVPYAVEGLYCTYIVTYSCGSVIKWLKNELLHGYKGGEADFYSYLEKRMPSSPSELLLLPLFSGALIPYRDLAAKGALIGLTPATTDGEIYRAILEGLAYEMRFETGIAEKAGIPVGSAVATGGGANSRAWLQIKADIQGIPYSTLRSVEGGLCGCAMLQYKALCGGSFEEAAGRFVQMKDHYSPRPDPAYEENYRKYVKIYPTVKELF